MRMYDTRSFDRVAQAQHSLNEIELLAADGSVQTVHRSEVSSRYIYKHEMELLLRVAGFARWEIYGDFDRRPLTRENDAMIVTAWNVLTLHLTFSRNPKNDRYRNGLAPIFLHVPVVVTNALHPASKNSSARRSLTLIYGAETSYVS